MHFKDFPQANRTFTGPEGMDDVNILPVRAHNDGFTTTLCMQLTPEDIEIINKNGGELWLSMTSGKSMPPVRLSVDTPFSKSQHFRHSFAFKAVDENGKFVNKIWIWNGVDEDIPTTALIDGLRYDLIRDENPVFKPGMPGHIGDFLFVLATEEQQTEHDCRIIVAKRLKGGEAMSYPTNL